MKTIRAILLAIAVAFGANTSLRADAALDGFKKEMEALEAYTKQQEAALKENPMGGIAMIRNMIGKIKAVKTDGLPDDLKAGFGDFVTAISKVGDIFKDWPEKPEEMMAFVQKKAAEDPKFMEAFGEKMAGIEKEMQPAIEKLDALGKKYGLDNLGSLAPGK